MAYPKRLSPKLPQRARTGILTCTTDAVRNGRARCRIPWEELMCRKIVKLSLFAAAMAFGSASGVIAQTAKQLRVTIPVIGMNFLPLFVAADKGLFAKEGFEVEIISTSGDGP